MIPISACTVLTAPVDGRLTGHLATDTPVRRGDVVATLDASGRTLDLHAAADGRVGGPPLRPTQAVAAGEGVLWVSREAA